MLAPAFLPEAYRKWNLIHGAPFGRPLPTNRLRSFLYRLFSNKTVEQLQGPFSIQQNNTTREFEYPWAFYSAEIRAGMTALDLGGGLGGFQFVLDRAGCNVINIDPGMEAQGRGWPCDVTTMRKLNQLFRTNVDLRNTTIEKAGIDDNSIDRVFSISVIEHLTAQDLANAMHHAYRCLQPGGLFILTIDLFLNLYPFSSRSTNEFGHNQNVRALVNTEDWVLVHGNREQLYGFDEFNPDLVLRNLETYLIGKLYPALVQCLVLKKEGDR